MSLANSVPLPGIFPSWMEAASRLFGEGYNIGIMALLGAHRLFALLLIFLALLALRNRFRIR